MFEEDLRTLDFDIENLPVDVARFDLLFQPVYDHATDEILLLACGNSRMLLHARDLQSEPTVMRGDIQQLEMPIRQAWDFLDSLHRQLGIE